MLLKLTPVCCSLQYREKKNGKDVRLKDDPTENGHRDFANGPRGPETGKKPAQNNRKVKSAANKSVWINQILYYKVNFGVILV